MIKIAIPSENGTKIAGHAGRARQWLIYDNAAQPTEPRRIELEKQQVLHDWKDQGPHPLDNIDLLITASAGDAFVRRMATRGVTVRITGERDAARAVAAVRNGQPLPEPPFDPYVLFCKVRDLFSRH
jgi:predicted Fe-Mo cluster-binding NifX family protein